MGFLFRNRREALPEPQTFENRSLAVKRRTVSSFVLFDVVYLDGSRSSNRKVPRSIVESLDGEKAVRAVIEAQDREIAVASGRPTG
jgi:hypothetical protein